ncbi:MAG: alpha amylase C-terminal domain-containing protein [Alistipes sp.]|nr:alpha amylase C-terminal domain-containing protein [Alistipes sp.]
MYTNPEWSHSAVLYEMNIRQLTAEGSFRAATERLAFLRSIGIDAIWLMPIYPIGDAGRKGSLGSYYSIKDYKSINPEFGSEADFRAFVKAAHALGMRVLLDWVANHTARDARWLTERPADWYERDEQGVAKVPWDWTDTAKLNYSNHDVWLGQIDAMRYWVEEFGVDGFRCDMAMLVPIEFWQEVSNELHRIKPDIFMLAEAEEDNLFDNAFNASYQWNIHHIMVDIAKGARRVWDMRNAIHSERTKYPKEAIRMSFTSNHDENSWSGSEQDRFGVSLETMTAMTFLMPSTMPLIYTGQEVGYNHSFAFFDRDPIPEDSYRENRTTELYRRLAALKHSERALAAGAVGGEMIEIENNAKDCMFSFVREVEGSRVVAIVNLSPYTIHADFRTGIYAGDYRDALTGEKFELKEHFEQDLAPWSYRILVKK